jgi:hypothetical protein
MNTDLFLALLSMDSYNRPGFSNTTTTSATTVGLKLPDSAANGIGNAFVYAPTAQSDIPGDSFSAQGTAGSVRRLFPTGHRWLCLHRRYHGFIAGRLKENSARPAISTKLL